MSVHYELRCRECGKTWGNVPKSFCEECFSPLEVTYVYDALKKIARRENLAGRAFNMWRYSERPQQRVERRWFARRSLPSDGA